MYWARVPVRGHRLNTEGIVDPHKRARDEFRLLWLSPVSSHQR